MPYKNPEDRKRNKRDWAKKNHKRLLEKGRFNHAKNREAVIKKLGTSCVRCGFLDIRGLQIDHIETGHGEKDRKRYDTRTFYRQILLGKYDVSKLQILCANCNWIKRHENGEFRGCNH